MLSSISSANTPASAAPLETTSRDATVSTPSEPRAPSPRSGEHIPLSSRRASTESARAQLQVKAGASRSPANTPTSSATQPGLDEILESTLAARSGIFEALGIDEDTPPIQPFSGLAASASTPSISTPHEASSEPDALAAKNNEAIDSMLALPPHELATQVQTALDRALGTPSSAADNPVGHEDAERASLTLTRYIETGDLAGAAQVKRNADPATQLADDIQRCAQTLLPLHAPATPAQRMSAVSLAAAQSAGIPGAAQMVNAASVIAGHERSIQSGAPVDTAATFRKLTRALRDGLSALSANEFKSGKAAFGASLANVAMRNFASVAIPTFARQMLSAQIERGLAESGISDAHRALLGGSFAALPMLLLAGGAYRAHRNPNATQAEKTEGDYARGTMAAMSFSALLGGIFSGQLGSKTSGATAQMIAFTLYTFMRDVAVQSHVRLKNPNMEQREPGAKPVPDKLHWGLISLIYGVDQFGVNQLMPTAAPISGPGAYHAHLGPVEQAKAAGIRAGINWAGEIIEDMSFNGIAAVRDKTALRLGLKWEPKPGHVANGALGPLAVRTAITQTNVVFGDVIDKALGDTHPLLSNLLPAITMGGLLNGIFYWPFANAGKGAPSAGQQSGVTETVLPDVDLDDSRSVRSRQRQSATSQSATSQPVELSTRATDVEAASSRTPSMPGSFPETLAP